MSERFLLSVGLISSYIRWEEFALRKKKKNPGWEKRVVCERVDILVVSQTLKQRLLCSCWDRDKVYPTLCHLVQSSIAEYTTQVHLILGNRIAQTPTKTSHVSQATATDSFPLSLSDSIFPLTAHIFNRVSVTQLFIFLFFFNIKIPQSVSSAHFFLASTNSNLFSSLNFFLFFF